MKDRLNSPHGASADVGRHPMPLTDMAIWCVAAPAAVTTVLWRLLARVGTTRRRTGVRWFDSVAPPAALCIAFVGLFGLPGFSPREDWMLLFHVAAGAFAVIVFAEALLRKERRRRMIRLIMTVAVAWLVSPGWLNDRIAYGAGLVVVTLASQQCLAALASRSKRAATQGVLFLAGSAVAVVVLLSGNLKIAQLTGAACTSFLVAALLSLAAKRRFRHASDPGVAAILLPALAFVAHVNSYSEIPLAAYVLAVLSPAAGLIVDLIPARNSQSTARQLARIVLVAAAATAAVAWSLTHSESPF